MCPKAQVADILQHDQSRRSEILRIYSLIAFQYLNQACKNIKEVLDLAGTSQVIIVPAIASIQSARPAPISPETPSRDQNNNMQLASFPDARAVSTQGGRSGQNAVNQFTVQALSAIGQGLFGIRVR